MSNKKLFFYELEGRGYTFQNKNLDAAKHGFEDDMLNMAWEMWSSGKAQAAEKIEALQNAVIFADECRKEWHESYMKLRKDKAALENSIEVNNMWIKDKSVKPEIDSLVVIAVLIDADVLDYRVALFSNVVRDDVEVGMFEVWDELGTILAIEEIEAYTLLQEYNRRKGL